MIKCLNYFFCLLFVASLMFACKPVRKSYVPYRKRNKCGCPTYGLEQKEQDQSVYFWKTKKSKSLL